MGEGSLPNRFFGEGLEDMVDGYYFISLIDRCSVHINVVFAIISNFVFFAFEVVSKSPLALRWRGAKEQKLRFFRLE